MCFINFILSNVLIQINYLSFCLTINYDSLLTQVIGMYLRFFWSWPIFLLQYLIMKVVTF